MGCAYYVSRSRSLILLKCGLCVSCLCCESFCSIATHSRLVIVCLCVVGGAHRVHLSVCVCVWLVITVCTCLCVWLVVLTVCRISLTTVHRSFFAFSASKCLMVMTFQPKRRSRCSSYLLLLIIHSDQCHQFVRSFFIHYCIYRPRHAPDSSSRSPVQCAAEV